MLVFLTSFSSKTSNLSVIPCNCRSSASMLESPTCPWKSTKKSNIDRFCFMRDSILVMLTSYFQLKRVEDRHCHCHMIIVITKWEQRRWVISWLRRESHPRTKIENGQHTYKYLKTSCNAPTRSVSSINTDVRGGPSSGTFKPLLLSLLLFFS